MRADRRLSLIVLGFVALLVAVRAAADDTPRVPPEPYFRHGDFGALKLSPSGKYIGAVVPAQGRLRLAVIDLDAKTSAIAGAIDGEDIVQFDWVNDGRLVFTIADLQAGSGEQRGEGLFAVNRDGTDFRRLAPTARAQANQG